MNIDRKDMSVTLALCAIVPTYCWLMYFINPLHGSAEMMHIIMFLNIGLTGLFIVLPFIRLRLIRKESENK